MAENRQTEGLFGPLALPVSLFRGRSCGMSKTLPKLGTPTKYGYRSSKGFVRKGDKVVQQAFWLGPDPTLALQKLLAIEDAAAAHERDDAGRIVWADEAIAALKQRFQQIENAVTAASAVAAPPVVQAVPVFAATPLPPRPDLPNLTLHAALDQYVAHVNGRNEIGLKTKTMTKHRIKSIKHHLPDVPLAAIQFEHLQEFRNVFTARPVCRRQRPRGGSVADGRPISVMTARNWLSTLGQAFRWFRKTNRWAKPVSLDAEDLEQVFFLSKSERNRICSSREERQMLGKPKPTPTLDELCLYYKLAAPGQRLYLLMGICLGWRQAQITDLRKQDLVRRGGEYFIKFERTKTNVEAELWVCPELAAMLIARVQKTPNNPDNYALLTENDMPLVHTTRNGHDTDSIGLVWDSLRRRVVKVGCRSHPFDSLRRFAGQAVSNAGDPFLAQVFLAQVPQSVLEQHYAGRGIGIGVGQTAFAKVHEVQRKVHAALKPMFDAVNEPTDKVVARVNRTSGPDATAAA